MEYHRSANPLHLREYGRNIQLMAELLQQETDLEKQQRMANEIIRVMSILIPNNKDIAEFRKKLWEHLFRMTNYELTIETPFEIVKPEDRTPPTKIKYATNKTRYRQYGKNIELMVEKILEVEPGPPRDKQILLVINIMRQFLQYYGNTTPNDQTISDQLTVLSNGKIQLTVEDIQRLYQEYSQHKYFNPTQETDKRGKRDPRKHDRRPRKKNTNHYAKHA